MTKYYKAIKYISLGILLLIVLLLFALPRVATAYLNNNSKVLLGRQAHIESIRFNYITCALKASDLKVYEANNKDVFVAFDEFKVNIGLWPSLKGDYTISSLLLDDLELTVENSDRGFNFSDLLPQADSTAIDAPNDTSNASFLFSLNRIHLKNSIINYRDLSLGTAHCLKNIDLTLAHFSLHDSLPAAISLSFIPNKKGLLKLQGSLDGSKDDFSIRTKLKDFDLDPFSPYLTDYINSDGVEGTIDYDLFLHGNVATPEDFSLKGLVEIQNFVLHDDRSRHLSSFDLLGINIDSIRPAYHYFSVSKFILDNARIDYSVFEQETSIDRLLQPLYSSNMQDSSINDTLLNDTVLVDTSSNNNLRFFVDTVVLKDANLHFADYSMKEHFQYIIDSLNVMLDRVHYNSSDVPMRFSALMNGEALLQGEAVLNMLNPEEIVYKANLQALDLTVFSPYSEHYIGRSLTSGHLNFSGDASMSSSAFIANNVIRINDINMGPKTEKKPIVKAPVKLALGILKDVNGDVAIDLPIQGDPSDPEFRIGKLVGKTLADFLVKVAATPFAVVGDVAGVNPERLKELPLEIGKARLGDDNKKRLDQVAKSIANKPELKFIFTLESPVERERAALAIAAVKAMYLRSDTTLNKQDDIRNDDNGLLAYMHLHSNAPDTATYNEKCISIVGTDSLKVMIQGLQFDRNKALKDYLFVHHNLSSTSISIRSQGDTKQIQEQKKARFRVEVSMK